MESMSGYKNMYVTPSRSLLIVRYYSELSFTVM